MKDALCSLPVLRAPDFTKPFALVVDVSKEGNGALLKQPDKDGIHHQVCYYSEKVQCCTTYIIR